MMVKNLSLVNFRGCEHTEIEFEPGVNIIAGVNGSGKSSILDALRILTTLGLSKIGVGKIRLARLKPTDIRASEKAADLFARLSWKSTEFECLVHHNREQHVAGKEGEVRSQTRDTPDKYEVSHSDIFRSGLETLPFALYFSPHRTLVSNDIKSSDAQLGPGAVYADALAEHRPYKLRVVAEWWLSQLALAEEDTDGIYNARTETIQTALQSFVPEFTNVMPVQGEIATLEITKGNTNLDILQLSDGERAMLALVLEIARRLTLANPWLKNPICDGEALILIDEIELHLHPKWQREIVQRLQSTFPKCQFIVTTHSPHVIAQVKANLVTVIEPGGAKRTPTSTFGLPASEILESVQEVPPLHQELIDALMLALDEFEIEEATALLDRLRLEVETPNQLVSHLETLIGNTRALLEDATNEEPAHEVREEGY